MSVGEDESRSLGVPVRRIRFILIAASSLGTAAIVSAVGLIGFVGIIVPHFAQGDTRPTRLGFHIYQGDRTWTSAFGDDAAFVRDLGYYVSIFTVPNYLQLDHSGLYYGAMGKKVGIFSGGDGSDAKASFFFATLPLQYDRRDITQQKDILRDHFQQEGWEVPRLLELMESAPDFYFDSVSQVKMNRWSSGRSVLLGDAAYCASPLSGMGTGMAVVGAYILAGELATPEARQRFRMEAEAAANLQHPNIVAIHEVGEHEGRSYFSMDFSSGNGSSIKPNWRLPSQER